MLLTSHRDGAINRFGEQAVVRFSVKMNGHVVGSDELRVLASPYFVGPNSLLASTVFVSADDSSAAMTPFANGMSGFGTVSNAGATGIYIQDHVEFGYTRTGESQTTYRAMQAILGLHERAPSLEGEIDDNVAYFFLEGHQHGGNLLVTPDTSGNDGYIVCGNNLAITNFLRQQEVQTLSGDLVCLDTEWLNTKHVDNLVAFVPVTGGYKVLVADLVLATNLLLTTTNETDLGASCSASTMRYAYTNGANAIRISTMKSKLDTLRSDLSAALGVPESLFPKIPVAFHPDILLTAGTRPYLPDLVNLQYVRNGTFVRGCERWAALVLSDDEWSFPFSAAKASKWGGNIRELERQPGAEGGR